jgi:hypothetical protein
VIKSSSDESNSHDIIVKGGLLAVVVNIQVKGMIMMIAMIILKMTIMLMMMMKMMLMITALTQNI